MISNPLIVAMYLLIPALFLAAALTVAVVAGWRRDETKPTRGNK